jgi:hypothetical protein
LTGEGRNDAAGVSQIGVGRGEAGVDDGNLIRMYRDAPDEPVAAGNPATFGESDLIPKITVQRIERENASRVGGE